MFSQSLSKGSEEAQLALQQLTTYLEIEGANGRISPAVQKKVLGKREIYAESAKLFDWIYLDAYYAFYRINILLRIFQN